MTAVIADTDILSTFGKVGRLDLLRQRFQHIYVAPAVYRELLQADRMGFPWVDCVMPVIEPLPLTTDESQAVEVWSDSILNWAVEKSKALFWLRRIICSV